MVEDVSEISDPRCRRVGIVQYVAIHNIGFDDIVGDECMTRGDIDRFSILTATIAGADSEGILTMIQSVVGDNRVFDWDILIARWAISC